MRNITVSVPEEVYRAARIRAAELDSSVSALVAAYLRSLTDSDERFDALAAQQRRITRGIESFSMKDNLSRDELHDRSVR